MTRAELRIFLSSWFCGCGRPEDASKTLLRILELHPLYDHRAELEAWITDEGVLELLLHTLDSFDLTEHGGTVGGAWLSAKGEAVRDALCREQADGFSALHGDYCIHGIDLTEQHDCVNTPPPESA